MSEGSRGFFEGGVEALEGASHGEEHVGIAQKRQDEECAGQSVYFWESVYAERFERLLEDAAGAKCRYVEEAADEGWDYEWQGGEDGPCASEWQIGLGGKPGDGDGEEGGACSDEEDEEAGSSDEVEGANAEQEVPRFVGRFCAAYQEVGGGQEHGDADACRWYEDCQGDALGGLAPTLSEGAVCVSGRVGGWLRWRYHAARHLR